MNLLQKSSDKIWMAFRRVLNAPNDNHQLFLWVIMSAKALKSMFCCASDKHNIFIGGNSRIFTPNIYFRVWFVFVCTRKIWKCWDFIFIKTTFEPLSHFEHWNIRMNHSYTMDRVTCFGLEQVYEYAFNREGFIKKTINPTREWLKRAKVKFRSQFHQVILNVLSTVVWMLYQCISVVFQHRTVCRVYNVQ